MSTWSHIQAICFISSKGQPSYVFPKKIKIKMEWSYLLSYDCCLQSFNATWPLWLMKRKCINLAFWLSTGGFWFWYLDYGMGNQKSPVANHNHDLFMHYLIMSCNRWLQWASFPSSVIPSKALMCLVQVDKWVQIRCFFAKSSNFWTCSNFWFLVLGRVSNFLLFN